MLVQGSCQSWKHIYPLFMRWTIIQQQLVKHPKHFSKTLIKPFSEISTRRTVFQFSSHLLSWRAISILVKSQYSYEAILQVLIAVFFHKRFLFFSEYAFLFLLIVMSSVHVLFFLIDAFKINLSQWGYILMTLCMQNN